MAVDFLAKYCIFSQEKLAKHKRAFEAADTDGDHYLNHWQVLIAPSEALTSRILEIVDYYVTDGLTDLRLFAVMASLAQKIAALE
ncbi:mucin-5ac-like isoform x3 [Limosa lapponica baueri]|uniref:Mucin-5ac-like isoform x3 n=1 Tax=Limosa lapponica baueri TaxID=1758121 RepID=A0A2I0UF39_LIMLA|nr:mucin-5ac-like isoform x3 [Limosa lapponica baueri]